MLMIETSSGSIPEILKAQELAENAADKRVQEWQRKVKVGDCFKQITPDGLEIFGEVLQECNSPDWPNWRECCCYSMACPEGEPGYVHVSQMNMLISRRDFDRISKSLNMGYILAIKELKEMGYSFV